MSLQNTLKALSDPIRREILNLLKGGRLSAGAITEHFPVTGATFAKEEFGIEDKEILDAICYHTTGRGNMNLLEKIVYLADKIEPSRNYTDLTPIRTAAEIDLDSAMRMTALAVKNKFVSQGRDIHPMTVLMMKDLHM